ncbi:MAG: serine hydrolase [Neisseriaceae bacterium]|nr:serine hydrolase [Neisseriaceae bacterium]
MTRSLFQFSTKVCSTLLLGLSLSLSVPAYADTTDDDLDLLGQFLEKNFQTNPSTDRIAELLDPHYNSATNSAIANLALHSRAALVMNSKTGEVLYEKNANQVMPIASISKLVMSLVFLDARVDMNTPITITDAEIDRVKGTSSRLAIGTTLPRSELLHLALMSSENRASHALARTTFAGGMPEFIQKMNQKSRSLGMYNTAFYDPTGLDKRNVSTAADLALLVKHAYNYPAIRFNSTDTKGVVQMANGRVERYGNSNRLVNEGEWKIDLQKTGYIREAGRGMVLHATLANQPLIIVLLNSSSSATRVTDAKAIQSWVAQQKSL